MGLFRAINISASGLTAQSLRMDVIAQNIANVDTTRTAEGGAYRRRTTALSQDVGRFEQIMNQYRQNSTGSAKGVVASIGQDASALKMTYDPTHPDADENGYVSLPNVDVSREYIDMMTASRAYEANVTVINVTKHLAQKTLEIGR